MSSLRQTLPQDEECHFRQAIQCTICLNSGHSVVDCNMWIYCPICHSKAHTVEQRKYNMLNRPTPAVRSVDTQYLHAVMTNDANQNDPSIRSVIGARNGSTGITGITMIPRKKSRRRRNTRVIAAIIRTTADMTTIGRPTSVVVLMNLTKNIVSIEINDDTRRAQMMTVTRSCIGTKPRHLAMADVSNKTRRSKRSKGKGICRPLQQKGSPASIASCATSPDITLRNVLSTRVRAQLSILFQRKFNRLKQGSKRRMRIGPQRTNCVGRPKLGLTRQTRLMRSA